MRIRLAFLCAVTLVTWASAEAFGARPELVPPPQGKDVTVKVMRGGRAVIPLEAFTRNMSRVVFGIDPRRQPEFGRLNAIQPKEGKLNQATVAYIHGDDDKSTADEFYFTVQRTSGGGSGRARVKIQIIDPPPILAAPAAIDFGEVVIGETPIRTVSLSNLGGGRLPINLKVPEPFQLEADGQFSIGRGKSADVPLSFRPSTAGEFVSYVQPAPSEPGTKIALRGTALAPIEVNAASDTLKLAADGTRSTTIALFNNASQASDVSVLLPSDVPISAFDDEAPATNVKVAPGETRVLTLCIAPENKGAYTSIPVAFRVPGPADYPGDYATNVELSAPAVPPEVTVIKEPDFGVIEEGRTAKAQLLLTNSGGVSGDIRIKPQPPVRIVERQEAFTIPAGGSVAVELSARLKKGEALPPHIQIELGGKTTNVPVRAGLAQPAKNLDPSHSPPPTPAPTPSAPTASHGWALNSADGISIDPDRQATTLRWASSKPGWKDPYLEICASAYGLWVRYEPLKPAEPGFWSEALAIPGNILAWFKSTFGGIDKSLTDRTDLDKVTGENIEKVKDEIRLPIAAQDINDRASWRLTAARQENGEHEPASECFQIDPNAKILVAAEPPQPPGPTNKVLLPELTIKGARAKSERRRAFLAVVVAYDKSANPDPKAADYQFEQVALQYTPAGMQVQAVDSKQTGSSAQTAEVVRAADTNLVEVRAVIEGLTPGTRTFWRLKQIRADGDPLVSGEISVSTKPPWEIPWRGILIGISVAALAVILYLRHRGERKD